jgi:molybdopterin converting factor small subunit
MPAATNSTITVHVLLFGSYAETLGLDAAELTVEAPATVQDALNRLRALPGGDRLPSSPLCAVNLAQARTETTLSNHDELAILPPLAGG